MFFRDAPDQKDIILNIYDKFQKSYSNLQLTDSEFIKLIETRLYSVEEDGEIKPCFNDISPKEEQLLNVEFYSAILDSSFKTEYTDMDRYTIGTLIATSTQFLEQN